jgi:hypothetical protein
MSNQSADEIIIVRYILDAQEAIIKAKEFRAQVDGIKTQLTSMAKSSGQSFKDLAVGMQQVAKIDFKKQVEDIRALHLPTEIQRQKIQEVTAAYNQQRQAISTGSNELLQGQKNLAGGFGVLGQAIGTALGFGAVQIISKAISMIRDLVQYLQEATESGYELAKGMFQLAVGVNALRRAGVDITFGAVLEQLRKLKSEFGIFSTKELVVGASAFLNLNRDMGFTEKQLFSLQEAIATLAVVNGRAMDEVQKTVALALSSGYTEGLQRLGVSINRVTIAEEAARLGWDKGYTALTEQQRALATYNLILQKTSVYQKDLLQYQNTLAGQIDTTTASITDLNAATGENLLAFKLLGEKLKELKAWLVFTFSEANIAVRIVTSLYDVIENLNNNWDELISNFNNVQEANKKLVTSFLEVGFSIEGLKGLLTGSIQNLKDYWSNVQGILDGKIAIKPPAVTEFGLEALTEDQIALVESANERILDLQTQYDNDRRDLEIDLWRDLEKIDADYQRDIEEQERDHQQKLLDIARKASDAIRDAGLRYNLDVSQAWNEYYGNIASATEKHNNKLLKLEEDYQEKLKRIKEGFLMDLEDALRERDARQVLQLIKRYNLDRTQATRERDQNLKEEERSYREQLHELDRQRDERLRKLREEFNLRLQMIEEQKLREIEAENARYAQQQIDEQNKWIVERANRQTRYQQDLDDLSRHLDDRLKEIAKGLADEIAITVDGMEILLEVLKAYLGPGGAATKVYDYFVAYARAAMAAVVAAMAIWSNKSITYPEGKPYGRTIPSNPFKKAAGGIEYADKPTSAIYGDAGPELHLWWPLRGGIGSLTSSTKTNIPDTKQSEKDKLQIEVLLGAGLEGRIIDKTMGEMAHVVLGSVRK